MKRLLSPAQNPAGWMVAAGAVYAAAVMILHARDHHGVIDASVIVAAIGAVAAALTRRQMSLAAAVPAVAAITETGSLVREVHSLLTRFHGPGGGHEKMAEEVAGLAEATRSLLLASRAAVTPQAEKVAAAKVVVPKLAASKPPKDAP